MFSKKYAQRVVLAGVVKLTLLPFPKASHCPSSLALHSSLITIYLSYTPEMLKSVELKDLLAFGSESNVIVLWTSGFIIL